jgi:hypothetical protein
MLTSQQATGSRKIGVASCHVRAVVLAGSWLVAGATAAQMATSEEPVSAPQPAIATSPDHPNRDVDLGQSPVRRVEPMVSGNLSDPVWRRLRVAFASAQGRIRTKPDCSALFTTLGADGFQLLMEARFAPATSEGNRNVCERATAGTRVGSRTITLCPAFAAVSVNEAALVLIHEVLHHAGLGEKPADPGGLTSAEINRLVEVHCSH